MTATVTSATADFLAGSAFTDVSVSVGVPMALLLVVLLTCKELLRTVRARLQPGTLRVFDVVMAPLLLTVVLVVVERFRALA
jgi:hypothetical protein